MAHTIDELCNGCSACLRQCPVQSITGEINGMFTIDQDRCINCGVCGFVCPVEAVTDEHGRRVERIPRDERPRPVVDVDLCNGCGTCVDICPFDCRVVVGEPPYSGISCLEHPLACVACGECSRACLKGAIVMIRIELRDYDPDQETKRLEIHLEESA